MMRRSHAQGVYRVPDDLPEDLETFRRMVEQFKLGTVSAPQFRAFRVPQGVYEQREFGTFMLRVRLPAGAVLPFQMRVLAEVANRCGNGILHVTTRQDIQIHGVALDGICPALFALYGAGLSAKGGGGNTVRNIVACFDAGVCAREAFDVTAYSVALTEFLLSDSLSYRLPRKYKIAFSGCGRDCAGVMVNDLGFIAKRRDGRNGFVVYVGGGLGAKSRVADMLEEFVPVDEFHLVAEAVKRVFDKHGDRKNKRKARLRFLIQRIGFSEFRKLYQRELAEARTTCPKVLDLQEIAPLGRAGTGNHGTEKASDGFDVWRDKSVLPQRQSGSYMVRIPLFLGEISSETMVQLAAIVENHGERMIRTTNRQDIVLRRVDEGELVEVYESLRGLDLADIGPIVSRGVVACAGASTCRLGICLSRGLAKAIREELEDSELSLDDFADLHINISGCPNACGRHPVAPIGFFGAARRVDGRLVPNYIVQTGGHLEEGKTKLAEGNDAIAARNVPVFVVDLLKAFRCSPQYPDIDAFFDGGNARIIEGLLSEHRFVPKFEDDKGYYFDWGAQEAFSLAGRGPGECSAGVFDLIEVDLASARDAFDEGRYYSATVLAARALLVAFGEAPKNDPEALKLFHEHIIRKGHVDASLEAPIREAARCASDRNPNQTFKIGAEDVADLISAVKCLYDNMDSSLRFPAIEPTSARPTVDRTADRRLDCRGVACPLNYVKTELALEQMKGGQILSVLLDEEGRRNVPTSAAQDGHDVLGVAPEGDHWRIVIRKRELIGDGVQMAETRRTAARVQEELLP